MSSVVLKKRQLAVIQYPHITCVQSRLAPPVTTDMLGLLPLTRYVRGLTYYVFAFESHMLDGQLHIISLRDGSFRLALNMGARTQGWGPA